MKSKIFILFIFFILGCTPKKYIYIQNKTNSDIQIFRDIVYDIPKNDSLIRTVMKKNNLSTYNDNHNVTINYYKILKPDSLVFLEIVHGTKSKTQLIDPNKYYSFNPLFIIFNSDTIKFEEKEIMKNINEAWYKKMNSSVKLKSNEKNEVIWEFRGTLLQNEY